MARYAQSILDIVCTAGKHMTAEQIFLLLKEEHPAVVIATVYNNLNALTEKGLIRKISVEGFPDRYDCSVRHDHLVCKHCGKLMDIDLPDMTKKLVKETGMPVESYDLKLYYTCDECKAAQEVATT
ncbi:MAG: transcriptional repressor [Phoenicibacter congonensis]|uniref:Transcriptional repressor n=1 Tax=Phoenicibacter congonensis TaxID=1944646 RepID=A0AA43RI24_9ACTN|nr:transcriptional repressor [Phoenicibacter congonensis]